MNTVNGRFEDVVYNVGPEEWSRLRREYRDTEVASGEVEREDLLHGRRVSWLPTRPDQILRVPSEYVLATPMNVFDYEKLRYMYNRILDGDVIFETPYGYASVIGLTDIAESMESYLGERFDEEYEHMEEPWSTGREDFDRLIVANFFHEQELKRLDEELREAFNEYRTSLADPEIGPDAAQQDLAEAIHWQINPDLEDLTGLHLDDLDELLAEHGLSADGKTISDKIEELVQYAQAEELGDLGEVEMTLRDGNHRAFSAIEAGEPYLYVSAHNLKELRRSADWPKIEQLLVE